MFQDMFSAAATNIYMASRVIEYNGPFLSRLLLRVPFLSPDAKETEEIQEEERGKREQMWIIHTQGDFSARSWPRGNQESQEGREGTCGIGLFTLRSQQIFAVLPTEQIPILAPPHV